MEVDGQTPPKATHSLVPWLPATPPQHPSPHHCHTVFRLVAQVSLHRPAPSFGSGFSGHQHGVPLWITASPRAPAVPIFGPSS